MASALIAAYRMKVPANRYVHKNTRQFFISSQARARDMVKANSWKKKSLLFKFKFKCSYAVSVDLTFDLNAFRATPARV